MNKIETIINERKKAHSRFISLESVPYMKYLELEQTVFNKGELSKKVKELIAIGISIVIDCESCMQWHIEHAAREGAAEKEILEAIEVGIEMGGGPAIASARFALEVMDYVFAGS